MYTFSRSPYPICIPLEATYPIALQEARNYADQQMINKINPATPTVCEVHPLINSNEETAPMIEETAETLSYDDIQSLLQSLSNGTPRPARIVFQ